MSSGAYGHAGFALAKMSFLLAVTDPRKREFHSKGLF